MLRLRAREAQGAHSQAPMAMGDLKVEIRMVYRIRSSKLGIAHPAVAVGGHARRCVVQAHHDDDADDVLLVLGEDKGEAPTPVLEEGTLS